MNHDQEPERLPAPRSQQPAPEPRQSGAAAHRAAARRRRLAQVFGEVLPSTTSDERGEDVREESGHDAWLRSQVPPHHGPAR